MLVSPRKWFALPSWLRAQGTRMPARYSHGFRALEIRVLGALAVAAILWIVYRLF